MNKHRQIKPQTNYSFIVVAGIIIIAIFGIVKAGIYQPTSTTQSDPTTYSGNWKRITNANALFSSKIFLNRSSTYVYIPIKFDDATKIAWLTLDSTSSAQPKTFIITHPQLENINWSVLDKDVVRLYQRKQTYSSIDAFVTNPPPGNKVAIETGIKQLEYYKDVPGYPIDEAFTLDSVDYILTTYTNPKKTDGAFHYQNIIDASEATVNSDNSLSWRINVPEASSASAFYLGQIHIDYNRTK